MRQVNFMILLFCALLFNSCKTEHNILNSEDQLWRLGWRMIESYQNDNYTLAELQLDSLTGSKAELDKRFVRTGFEVLNNQGKKEKMEQFLMQQNDEYLKTLCDIDYLNAFTPCSSHITVPVTKKALQKELVKLLIQDQHVRSNLLGEFLEKYGLSKEEVLDETEFKLSDKIIRTRLKALLETHGFPTKEEVGNDGMQSLFLIIQHADSDVEWRDEQMVHIEQAVKNRDLDPANYAFLHDRINVRKGKKQRFGTQFLKVDVEKNIAKLNPCEDRENLDNRRREIGLMPIDFYKREMLRIAG